MQGLPSVLVAGVVVALAAWLFTPPPSPGNPAADLERADTAFEAGRFEAALMCYRAAHSAIDGELFPHELRRAEFGIASTLLKVQWRAPKVSSLLVAESEALLHKLLASGDRGHKHYAIQACMSYLMMVKLCAIEGIVGYGEMVTASAAVAMGSIRSVTIEESPFDDADWSLPSRDDEWFEPNRVVLPYESDYRQTVALLTQFAAWPAGFQRAFDAAMFRRAECPLANWFGGDVEPRLALLVADDKVSLAARTRAAWLLIESAAMPPVQPFAVDATPAALQRVVAHWRGLKSLSANERWRRNVELALSVALEGEPVSKELQEWIGDHACLGERAGDPAALREFSRFRLQEDPQAWIRSELGIPHKIDPVDPRPVLRRLIAAETGTKAEVEGRRRERFLLHSLLELCVAGERPGVYCLEVECRGVRRPIPENLRDGWLMRLGLDAPR